MKYNLITILLITSFLTACGTTTKNTSPEELIREIYKGTAGLEMNLMPGAPPEEVYERSPFSLNLEIENKGAFDIQNGWLSIGLEKDYMEIESWLSDDFSGGDSRAEFDLNGKSQLDPQGDKRIVSLKIKALTIKEEMSEKHESTIMATACYKYQTKVIETVCIDTDPHNLLSKEKVCEVEDITLSDQGAPLAVVKIEESMLPEEYGSEANPEFIIYIENKGNGQAIKDSQELINTACSAEPLSYENLNLVTISAFLPGPNEERRQLKCEPRTEENKAYIKLKDNRGYARCVLEEGIWLEEGTFLSPLTIILDYGYTFTISKPITITRILTY